MIKQKSFKQIYTTLQTCPLNQTNPKQFRWSSKYHSNKYIQLNKHDHPNKQTHQTNQPKTILMIKQKSFKQIYTTQQTCPAKQTNIPNKLTQNNFDDQVNIIQTNIYNSTNIPTQTNQHTKQTNPKQFWWSSKYHSNKYILLNKHASQTNKHTKQTNPKQFWCSSKYHSN